MKLMFEYVEFVEIEPKPKTKVFSCRNRNSSEELGQVKWYGPWRQYCYFPVIMAVYSKGCLRDIAAFISQLP